MTGTKRLVAVALGLVLLAACIKQPSGEITPYVPPPSSGQPSNAATTPTSTPSPTATPTVTPTQTKAELLAEAEKTYRAYVVETFKLDEAGGVDELPPGVTQYLAEPYQAAVLKSYVDAKASGITIEHMDRAVVKSIKEIDASPQPDALIAISACVDATNAVVYGTDGTVSGGNIIVRQLYFKRVGDGTLRIFFGTGDEVESC